MSESQKDRVQLSCRFERARVQQIVTEADLEKAAEDAKASEAAPFEEVLPVAAVASAACVNQIVDRAPEIPNKDMDRSPVDARIKESIVVYISISLGVALAAFLDSKYGRIDATYYPAIFLGCMVGALVCIVYDALEKQGIGLFGPIKKAIDIISAAALGAWTVGKNTARGISVVPRGLYYAVINQIMLSGCLSNGKRFYNWCSSKSRWYGDAQLGVVLFTRIPHFLGVAGSVLAVCLTDGTPLSDKLIFGWWAFYVLNIFCFIGRELSSKNKVSG